MLFVLQDLCCLCYRTCKHAVCVTGPVNMLFVLQDLQTCCLCYRTCKHAVCVTGPVNMLFVLQDL